MTVVKDRRGGFYFIDNKPYLSVTEILKIIDKPALRYWFGKEVYYAMVKDPTLSERDALAAPYTSSKSAMDRGTTIHSIVESYKTTKDPLTGIPYPYNIYAEAFYDFMNDHKIEIIEQEKKVISNKHMIAGTMDMLAVLNSKQIIVDVKTGKDIYQEASYQLTAYADMLREAGQTVDNIAVLLLITGQDGEPTGKYKFETLEEDMETFLAVKRLYCSINKEKCMKINYQG